MSRYILASMILMLLFLTSITEVSLSHSCLISSASMSSFAIMMAALVLSSLDVYVRYGLVIPAGLFFIRLVLVSVVCLFDPVWLNSLNCQ